MKITIEKGTETVISLSGQLDTLTATDFEKEIHAILADNALVVILNGSELTYVSSAGLRLLLTLQKGMTAKGGTLRLRNIKKDIMEIFNITGFSSILTIE
ncbi:MAG: STAS domain-containing protein [Tannerella sp.]|jgi:anti-sigma B factor antagonist/stage II sporulation protein AA (anti-sigma F factor antagonist)|nr:STAS domain-containing protein [Tannerella sp.]